VETSLVYLSIASAWIGHRQAGAQLRPLVERLRGRWLSPIPTMMWGFPAEHAIGVLDLLAGREDDAVVELYAAVERLDAQARPLIGAWSRQALAQALHANGEPDEARRVVAESIDLAQQSGFGFFVQTGRRLEAEFDGRPPATPPEPARTKPLRSLAARSGRRALAALVRNQDDAALETRFASARRQRGLLRAMARGFQPEQALGFTGVIAYELEPFEIAAPPEAPWRWTIAIDGRTARLVEPAPLDADITIHFGLADWVRVLAGELQPVTSMAAGRCRVEGDIVTASRLEAIFGVV
jgi:hypothetical protein